MLDYSSALEIKSALLPPSSRALASVHYQLATALEFTPDRRTDALSHVEQALSSFRSLRSELESTGEVSEEVSKMSGKEKEAEKSDVEALIGDLEVKIEELKAAPPAEDLVSQGINHLLGHGGSNGAEKKEDGPVNDLTGMVRKKAPKKDKAEGANGAETTNGTEVITWAEKRGMEDKQEGSTKKARLE